MIKPKNTNSVVIYKQKIFTIVYLIRTISLIYNLSKKTQTNKQTHTLFFKLKKNCKTTTTSKQKKKHTKAMLKNEICIYAIDFFDLVISNFLFFILF